MKKGRTIIRNPDEKRIRALMMLEYRIKNAATTARVAKEFGVSEKTVERTLSWARKAGLVVKAEDKILEELVPLAHQAIKLALEEGDSDVALEIFKGILPSFNKKTVPTNTGSGPKDELSVYIEQLRTGLGVIEGETIKGGSEKLLSVGKEANSHEILLLPAGNDSASAETTPSDGTRSDEGSDGVA